jgi:hypothetical protein
MGDLEKLKELIFELRAAGEDERLFVEDYVELCMRNVQEASEIVERLLSSKEVS